HFTAADQGIREAHVGGGLVLEGSDLERSLARTTVSRETLVDQGLEFTRRRYGAGRAYFVVNSSERDVDGWVPLDDRARSAVLFDPMTGRRGDLEVRQAASGALEVR